MFIVLRNLGDFRYKMKIINPRESLLIVSGSNEQMKEYVYRNNLHSYYGRKNIFYAGSDRGILGFCEVDVLFIYGWWNKRDIDCLLGNIGVYMRTSRSRVLGEEKFIPPYLWEMYKEMRCVQCETSGTDTINRFEILDIR